jgi:5-(carboxyamino)imidazole ribonucleotide synthase
MLPPGSTIGILGGGQLGRMLAVAAARLGLKTHIYCPEKDSPAFDVAGRHTIAPYDDGAMLERFARACDAVTLEFENVPVDTLRFCERFADVAPGPGALEITQDRLAEKQFMARLGIATASFADVSSREDLSEAIRAIGCPAILKTRRFGYDGKGQVRINRPSDAEEAFAAIGGQPAILEGFVRFEREISVVAARTRTGGFSAFDVTENEHRNHILDRSIVPARVDPVLAEQALLAARKIAEGLKYVGTFAVEFFAGEDGRLIGNEIAPRVHNSGHWTIDGAITCQFEQHIRAVAGWPLGSPARRCDVEMVNLIGADVETWSRLAAEPATKLHLYGKLDTREGRKMGHATRLLGSAAGA